MMFRDRTDAGRQLAAKLAHLKSGDALLVLALPRGGVPVAYEVARALEATLDIFMVRKLGAPEQPELALGALASGGVMVLNEKTIAESGVSAEELESIAQRERAELERRERAYRGEVAAAEAAGKVCLLVDDGLATGSSMRAAARALKARRPARIVIATPVAPRSTIESLRVEVDEVVCLFGASHFYAVGQFYERFDQTSDEEVRDLLARSRGHLERGI